MRGLGAPRATEPGSGAEPRFRKKAPLAFCLILATLTAATCFARPAASQAQCREWRECRQLALAAADRGEYETFHDLAWRAVQTGPPRDPDLMFLLARAQSLSGRPHDALVMLRRLAEMGVSVDVSSDRDFRRTRDLTGWPELEALIQAVNASALAKRAASSGAVPDTRPPGPRAAEPPAAASPAIAPPVTEEEVVRFAGAGMEPRGLAYDAVSGRFLVGDPRQRKLIVIGEESGRSMDLVRADSAGFDEIMAMEIDPRRGDLWVVSAGRAPGLHKLQLVSGRPIETITLPRTYEPARFSDVAVTANGTVLVLDSEGRRVFRLRPRAQALDLVVRLPNTSLASVAPTDNDRVAYVAHVGGLLRLDLVTRSVTPVRASKGLDLTGFARVRWHRRSILGVQRQSDGTSRVVQLRLDRAGRTGLALEVLGVSLPLQAAGTVALAGDELFYLTALGAAEREGPQAPTGGIDSVIRRLRLR